MKILFLHGWTSTPGGRKPTYLRDHGHTVINPQLPDDDFDAAVRIAQGELDLHQPNSQIPCADAVWDQQETARPILQAM